MKPICLLLLAVLCITLEPACASPTAIREAEKVLVEAEKEKQRAVEDKASAERIAELEAAVVAANEEVRRQKRIDVIDRGEKVVVKVQEKDWLGVLWAALGLALGLLRSFLEKNKSKRLIAKLTPQAKGSVGLVGAVPPNITGTLTIAEQKMVSQSHGESFGLPF